MSSPTEPTNVRILDREYTVGVAAHERETLHAAARMLESRMREIRGSNRMVSVERVAVLAALNLAHELQQLRGDGERDDDDVERVLASLARKLDRFDGL